MLQIIYSKSWRRLTKVHEQRPFTDITPCKLRMDGYKAGLI